jgi:hypothetical protein
MRDSAVNLIIGLRVMKASFSILPKSNPRKAYNMLSLILFLLHKNIDFIVEEQGITIVEDYDKFSSLPIKVSYV